MSRGEETFRISGWSPPRFPGASHVLNGFRYQLMQSLAAWLSLRNDEELWLEVSEDFSIRSAEAAEDVQVKASRAAAGPKTYSLQSDDVQDVLRRFWVRTASPDGGKRRLTFAANGGAARERYHEFPDKVPGLEYWHKAAIDADTAPIRAALSTIFADEPLGTWIASDPSDYEFRERLLRRC